MGNRFSRPDPEPVRESAPERMADIMTLETEPWPEPSPAPSPVDAQPPLDEQEIEITFGSN